MVLCRVVMLCSSGKYFFCECLFSRIVELSYCGSAIMYLFCYVVVLFLGCFVLGAVHILCQPTRGGGVNRFLIFL